MADYTSNLVGHWKLDDGSGTNANDSSASNRDGTLINTPSWTTGQLGGAVDFNGSSQYIDLGTHSELQVSGDMTVAAWINADAISGTPGDGNSVLVCLTAGLQVSYNFALGESNNFGLGWTNDAGVADSWATDGDPLATGAWFHIAAVRSSGNVTFYVNGDLVSGTHATGAQSVTTAGGQAAIGSLGIYPAFFFDGRIDDVRLYSRALTADDIEALHLSAVDAAVDVDGAGAAAFGASSLAESRLSVSGQAAANFVGEAAPRSTTDRFISGWTFNRRGKGSSLALLNARTVGIDTDTAEQTAIRDFFFPFVAGVVDASLDASAAATVSLAADSLADSDVSSPGAGTATLLGSSLADGDLSVSGVAAAEFVGSAEILADSELSVFSQGAGSFAGESLSDAASSAESLATASFDGAALADGSLSVSGLADVAFEGDVDELADGSLQADGVAAATLGGESFADGALGAASEAAIEWVGQTGFDADFAFGGIATASFEGASFAGSDFSMDGVATVSMVSDNDDAGDVGSGGSLAAIVRRRIPQVRQAAA